MSRNFIENLPLELLCRVFDLLDYHQLQLAMTVCQEWLKILSTPRYLRKQVLRLSEYIAYGNDIQDVQHYPVVQIYGLSVYKSLDEVRCTLLQAEMVRNLEELHICSFGWPSAKLFTNADRLHFPNLRKIRFGSLLCEFKDQYYAPNLECVEIKQGKTEYDCEGAFQLLDRVKEMSLESANGIFCANRSFPKLQRLTLYCSGDGGSDEQDFRTFAHNLTHLSVANCKQFISDGLLSLAKNLRVLKLTTPYCLNCSFIDDMKNLEELSVEMLNVVEGTPPGATITLPNLRKAKILTSLAVRLIAKNLTALDLNNTPRTPYCEKRMDTFFNSCRPRLQILELRGIEHSKSGFFTDHISNMTKLQTLKLRCSDMNQSDILKLLRSTQLRSACFLHCYVFTEDGRLSVVDRSDFFLDLKFQFRECAILTEKYGKL